MKAAPELSVDVHSDLVVLTPNIGRRLLHEGGERAEPSHDSTLRGTVRLSLTRDTKIKRVTVELVRPFLRASGRSPTDTCSRECQL